jgi:hypothetical protein
VKTIKRKSAVTNTFCNEPQKERALNAKREAYLFRALEVQDKLDIRHAIHNTEPAIEVICWDLDLYDKRYTGYRFAGFDGSSLDGNGTSL